jgi:hypothetical protein
MATAILYDWDEKHYTDVEILALNITVDGEPVYGAVAASEDGGWVVCIDGDVVKEDEEDGEDGCIFLEPKFDEYGQLAFIFKKGKVRLSPGKAWQEAMVEYDKKI